MDTIPQGVIPPHNIEAEQATLGSLLISKDALIKIADVVKADDFYVNKNQLIFEAMLDLYAKHEPIDILSLANRLIEKGQLDQIGSRSYLVSLANTVPTASNITSYAEIVKKKSTLRRLITAGQDIVREGYNEDEDLTTTLDKAEKALYAVSHTFLKQNFVPVQDIMTSAFDRIDELHRESGKLRGISTGFAALDNKLGGLQKSDLVILAARPSMGKTSLALDIARHVAVKGKVPVGVISLEMSKDQLVDRLLCAEANVDLWKMRTGKLTNDQDFTSIGHAMGQLAEAPIYIDDSPSANIMEIRTKARRLQMEHGLGLLVLDYLQLMEGRSSNSDNRVQEISEISRALKGLARELNIPVLALSQLSRAVEMQQPPIPRLSHLRESGCVVGSTRLLNAETGQLVAIEEVAKQGMSFETLTMDDHFQLGRQRLKKAWFTGRKQTYELRLASGRHITASANHPFRSFYSWKALEHLAVGEQIAIPRSVEVSASETVSDHHVTLLAHLIGDGCMLKRQPLHYTNADPLLIATVDLAAQQAFPAIKTRVIPQESWYHLYLTGTSVTRRRRKPIILWLESIGIYNKRAKEKFVPSVIFQLPLAQQALFLKHLWSTDGSIFRGKKGHWRLYYASSSRLLVDDVAHLLLRFGIVGRIKTSSKEGYGNMYTVDISGSQDQKKFLEQVGIAGKKDGLATQALIELMIITPNTNIDVVPKPIWGVINTLRQEQLLTQREFHAQLGWSYSGTQRMQNGMSRGRLAHANTILKDPFLEALTNSDILWDKIVEIIPQGERDVYDAEIEHNHNFVANDILIHNSIEQDADLVLFIYREDYYKKDSERKGVSEVIIAKHRNGPTGQVELYFDIEKASFRNLDKRHSGFVPPPAFAQASGPNS